MNFLNRKTILFAALTVIFTNPALARNNERERNDREPCLERSTRIVEYQTQEYRNFPRIRTNKIPYTEYKDETKYNLQTYHGESNVPPDENYLKNEGDEISYTVITPYIIQVPYTVYIEETMIYEEQVLVPVIKIREERYCSKYAENSRSLRGNYGHRRIKEVDRQ